MNICKMMFVGNLDEQKANAQRIFPSATAQVCIYATSNQEARSRLERDKSIRWVYIKRTLNVEEGLNAIK